MAAKSKDKKDGKKKRKVNAGNPKLQKTAKELNEGELDKIRGGLWKPNIPD
jgi:hypothetical protein